MKLWDISTGRQLSVFSPVKKLLPSALAFNRDWSMLALACGSWKGDQFQAGGIQFWDVKSRKHLATLEGLKRSVNSWPFRPMAGCLPRAMKTAP